MGHLAFRLQEDRQMALEVGQGNGSGKLVDLSSFTGGEVGKIRGRAHRLQDGHAPEMIDKFLAEVAHAVAEEVNPPDDVERLRAVTGKQRPGERQQQAAVNHPQQRDYLVIPRPLPRKRRAPGQESRASPACSRPLSGRSSPGPCRRWSPFPGPGYSGVAPRSSAAKSA